MKAFCPFCEKEYDNLEVQMRYEITTLNGVTAEWQKKYIVCPDCGEELYNGELHDENLRVLYAACKVSDVAKPVEDLCDYALKLRMENADLHERLKEAEHRAEVVERALATVCEEVLHARYPVEYVTVSVVEDFIQLTLKDAKREIEEKNDDDR